MLARNLLLSVSVALVTAITPVTVTAQSDITDVEAKRILDVAGRQQMLSERLSKSACLSVAHINFSANFDDLRTAFDEFKIAHYALLNGSQTLGIKASKFVEVSDSLGVVSKDFTEFAPYVAGLMNTGEISATDLNKLNDRGLTILAALTDTTETIARVHAANLDNVSVGQTITLNIAGRQRMLSQKMVKEMCMMHVNGTPSSTVGDTVSLFDASLNALISGFPGAGIMAPTDPALISKLSEVQSIWTSLKPIADLASEGKIPDADSLYMFSIAMEAALRTMSEAVDLYN